MTRIYIAGPMSGIHDNNYAAFADAKRQLTEIGYGVVSPTDITVDGLEPTQQPTSEQYQQLMRKDVRALIECDVIALLPGWENSRGATFERQVALMTGRSVVEFNEIIRRAKA